MEPRSRKTPRIAFLEMGTPGPSSTRIFIGALPHSTKRASIFHAFRHFGTILGISPIYRPRIGSAYAFVEFEKSVSAKQAVQASLNKSFNQRPVEIEGNLVSVKHFHHMAPRKNPAILQSSSRYTWKHSQPVSSPSSNAENAPPSNCNLSKSDNVQMVEARIEGDEEDEEDVELHIEDEVQQDILERESLSDGELPQSPGSLLNSDKRSSCMEYSSDSTDSPILTFLPSKGIGREIGSASSISAEGLREPAISSKAVQTDEPLLKPAGLMWRPPSLTTFPPDCVLVFREEDEISWVNSVHEELRSRNIRVEECLVKSTDNATIAAVLSHLGPTWEPLFAFILQEHNYAERSASLVQFSQSYHPMRKVTGFTTVQYDIPVNTAVDEVSSALAAFEGTRVNRRRILRYATYTMALGVGLWEGDSERLCEELLAIRGEQIYRTLKSRENKDRDSNAL